MKLIKVLGILLISLLCTGCFDVLQSVSMQKGEVKLTLRYTVQRGLVDIISEFSGDEANITDILTQADSTVPEYEGMSVEKAVIDNSFYAGSEIRMQGNLETIMLDNLEGYFLPIKEGSHFVIRLPELATEQELDGMAAAFLSGAKYTMLFDLHGDLKDISSARLVYDGEAIPDSEYMVNIYGSSMLVEIPMLFLFYAHNNFYLELY